MAHAASVKKAAASGIQLEDAGEESDYRFRAFWPEGNMELWGSDQGDLVKMAIYAKMMSVEHKVTFEQDDGTIMVQFNENDLAENGFAVEDGAKEFEPFVISCLENITDDMRNGVEEDEEDEARGSVVPNKYKAQYKENGTPGNCGDWLALLLKSYTTKDGGVDVDAVDQIADANDVKTAKYDRVNNGWQGRLRMTVRNLLVKKVMERGSLLTPMDDQEHKAPESWMKAMALRYKSNEAALAPSRKKKKAA